MTSDPNSVTWGVVATIKAPVTEILEFTAYHLDLGASRITICLDDDNAEAKAILNAHPNCRAIRTDDAYWIETCGYIPKKHQVRQALNATRVYRESDDIDWLVHIDVDEFLCPSTSITDALAQMERSAPCARVFPCESLCAEHQPGLDPSLTYCKARPHKSQRTAEFETKLYPTFGGMLKEGFISHTIGKQFIRTGIENVHLGIHRAFIQTDRSDRTELSHPQLPGVELCHRHVQSWEKWQEIMEFRLSRGSYREELGKNISASSGRISRHLLFKSLQETGPDDLRAFFEELCLATPALLARLKAHGLLRTYALDLSLKVQKHFPGFVV